MVGPEDAVDLRYVVARVAGWVLAWIVDHVEGADVFAMRELTPPLKLADTVNRGEPYADCASSVAQSNNSSDFIGFAK